MEENLYAFYTSALDGDEFFLSRCGYFTLRTVDMRWPTPGRPAHKQSLYWLTNPGALTLHKTQKTLGVVSGK